MPCRFSEHWWNNVHLHQLSMKGFLFLKGRIHEYINILNISLLLTMLFLSAFWIVYPVMAELPSSFGGFHDKFTFSPQTSSIVTTSGGPGRSVMKIWQLTSSTASFVCLSLRHTHHPLSLISLFLSYNTHTCQKQCWKEKTQQLSKVKTCQNYEKPNSISLGVWFLIWLCSLIV